MNKGQIKDYDGSNYLTLISANKKDVLINK